MSVATVSRVMNEQSGVRAPTRDKVLASVAKLGYRMNHLARSLRTAESRMLLTMVPDVGNPFYAQIVRGIDTVAREHGYFVLLCDTGADEGRERSYFDLLRMHRADGAICLDPDTVQHALSHESISLPWVACCEFDPGVAVPYVGIDNHRAASDAVAHLLAQGHTRIGLINSDERYLYARQRQQGYLDTLAAAGVPVQPQWMRTVQSLDYEAGTQATLDMMAQPDAPTAIFAVSDTLAIGVLSALRQLKQARAAGRGRDRLRRYRDRRADRSGPHHDCAADARTGRDGRATAAAAPGRSRPRRCRGWCCNINLVLRGSA